jgi:thiosulfate/3-mercaptopyruvate sulfurtransferase
MRWTTLISADELAHAIDRCTVVDCRHDLADLEAGRRAYAQGHLPGAFFLHMDDDLSGAKNGRNGRHPLPTREQVHALLAAIGLSDDRQLVVYDAQGGAMASRLWWMARWIGHEAVAVLDGGLPAWQRAGYPLATEVPAPV